ncbi:MAG: histidine phosphatase family protein [Acetatifactor sp.]|nr:histidine phosphatase family protein [Acetatifactor sp.]
MKLLIIRHGESEGDILDVHEGRADFELTERGHCQADAMSEFVSQNYQLAKIYHSTLKRAKQTAEHLALKTQAPLIPDEKLMEFNNGLIAGLKHSVADEKYPRINVPIHASVYEQESMLEFRYRAEYMLSKILSENDDENTIAVVSHGGMINQLYRAFLKLPVETKFSFLTGDTGIHEWVIKENSRIVLRANFIPHNI